MFCNMHKIKKTITMVWSAFKQSINNGWKHICLLFIAHICALNKHLKWNQQFKHPKS
jgi:hypothetical protein